MKQKSNGKNVLASVLNEEERIMQSEKQEIRLVAVDLDGTLLHEDKSISDYTLKVLRNIVKKGIERFARF